MTEPEEAKQQGSPKPRGRTRRSGKSVAREEAEKQADEITEPPQEKEIPEEREQWFRAPGFQRMKTDWSQDEREQMDRVKYLIDKAILDSFPEAYAILSDLWDIVREPVANQETGEIKKDELGFTVWARNPMTGRHYEDWSRVTIKDRENLIFEITTQLFEWQQRAGDLWTDAMFSKGIFTEKFSIEYDKPIHGTIEDRTAKGHVEAAEDKYFALMNAAISRKADALVRTMDSLVLRLRDSLNQ